MHKILLLLHAFSFIKVAHLNRQNLINKYICKEFYFFLGSVNKYFVMKYPRLKRTLSAVIFLLISACGAPFDPEDSDTNQSGNLLERTWSGYPIHRGYSVEIKLNRQNKVYLLGINFHADSYEQILNTEHVQEYDIILEFRSSDTSNVGIHSGQNAESKLFTYSGIHDFPEMKTLPDLTQLVQHVTVPADSQQYLLIRNRHNYYSKFLMKEQEWRYIAKNAEYLVRFVFEFYYYLQTEPDLSLH